MRAGRKTKCASKENAGISRCDDRGISRLNVVDVFVNWRIGDRKIRQKHETRCSNTGPRGKGYAMYSPKPQRSFKVQTLLEIVGSVVGIVAKVVTIWIQLHR